MKKRRRVDKPGYNEFIFWWYLPSMRIISTSAGHIFEQAPKRPALSFRITRTRARTRIKSSRGSERDLAIAGQIGDYQALTRELRVRRLPVAGVSLLSSTRSRYRCTSSTRWYSSGATLYYMAFSASSMNFNDDGWSMAITSRFRPTHGRPLTVRLCARQLMILDATVLYEEVCNYYHFDAFGRRRVFVK